MTAPRDAIIVRLDAVDPEGRGGPADLLDRGPAYRMEAVDGALGAALERINGGRLPGFIRLTRAQLAPVVALAAPAGRVRWISSPRDPLLPDSAGRIPGVTEHLAGPDPTTVPAASIEPPPIAKIPQSAPLSSIRVPREGAARFSSPARVQQLFSPKTFGGSKSPEVHLLRTLGTREPSRRASVDGSLQWLSIGLPDKGDPTYQDLLDLLKDNGFSLEPSNRRWWLRDRHKVLSFLAVHEPFLRERCGAEFTPGLESRLGALIRASVGVRASAVEDSTEAFEAEVALEAPGVPEEVLREALNSGRRWFEAAGKVVLIPDAERERLETFQRKLLGEPDRPANARAVRRLGAADLRAVEGVLEEVSPGFLPPEAWRERSAALGDFSRLRPAPVPPDLEARLRLYQRIGVAWMWHLYRNGLAGLLADEMGLGKTVQAIALLEAVRAERPEDGPALVVCPAGLIGNWHREVERFAPDLPLRIHHGPGRTADPRALGSAGLVLTSDSTLARDADLFAAVDWGCVVADEAQHLRNRTTLAAKALRRLQAKGRFVLTGTPVENRLDDLRNLFEFLLPGYLAPVGRGGKSADRAWFDDHHRRQAAPYILRRRKTLVAPELPERIEQTVFCEFGAEQQALYEEVRRETEDAILKLQAAGVGEGQLRMAVLTQLLRLRQVCAEPRVLRPGWKPAHSTKREALLEILDEVLDDDHRVLVFSTFTSVLDQIEKDLRDEGIPWVRLDGSMDRASRQAAVDRFQADPSVPVFLLSLKAGGVGLNLTGADTVIHFDPWWNPAAEAQATDRAHRIGQTKVVTSIRLIAAGTVEERVLALQDSKRAILESVWEESESATAGLSLADLRGLVG